MEPPKTSDLLQDLLELFLSNMEIYLYMQALDQLIVSCDQKLLYNPSALDVWVTADDKILKIESGKTVRI